MGGTGRRPGPRSSGAARLAGAAAAAAAAVAVGTLLASPAGAAGGEMALACAGVPQPKSAQPGETLNQAYAKAIAEGGPRTFIVKALDRENEAIALAYLAWNFPGFVADSTLSDFSIFIAELEPKQLLGVVSELEGVVDFIECDQ